MFMQTSRIVHRPTTSRQMLGFNMIELMIVLAIIGVLTMIAYPAYLDYANRARWSDAKNALLELASRQERFYFDNQTYTNNLADLGYNTTSPDGYYDLEITNATATSYNMAATPTFGGDTECGRFTLNSQNQRTTQFGGERCRW